jgi:hypothetical protein
MKKLNKDLFGWMVAAVLGGILASAGFQGATESSAVVDLQKVIKNSDLYKVKEAEFKDQVAARQKMAKAALPFIERQADRRRQGGASKGQGRDHRQNEKAGRPRGQGEQDG